MGNFAKRFSMLLIWMAAGLMLAAQVCVPTAPVCVAPGNNYAFQYSNDTDFGLRFNDNPGITAFQFTDGSGNFVFGVNALTGNASFGPAGALQIDANRPAFQFSGDPDAGLFFTGGAPNQYQYRSLDGVNIFTIDEDDGDLNTIGLINGIWAQSGKYGFNTDSMVGEATFTMKALQNIGHGGMAVTMDGLAVAPFYLYGVNDSAKAYHYFDSREKRWTLNNEGDHLTVQSNGYVGIGTIYPEEQFHVATGKVAIGDVGGIMAKLTVNSTGGAGEEVFRGRVNSVTRFIINGIGNTGIGTASPDNQLTVDGDADFTGNVGIGTNAPSEALHVLGGKALFGNGGGLTAKVAINSAAAEDPLVVKASNSMKLIVKNSGNVGIFTSSPSQELDINGQMAFGQSDGDKISLYGDDIDQDDMYGFGVLNNALHYKSDGMHKWFIAENADVGTPVMSISEQGRVGINVPTSASAKLHVAADTTELPMLVTYGGLGKLMIHSNGGSALGAAILPPSDGLRVEGDAEFKSDVIIGDATATGYRLAVDGKVICEELLISESPGWPDYVFADHYSLMKLEDLAAFVDENGHLPGVPPASAINGTGVPIGQIATTLMQKVEELTLYVLEQNDRLNEQAKIIQSQQQLIESLGHNTNH